LLLPFGKLFQFCLGHIGVLLLLFPLLFLLLLLLLLLC
jgi:hypothetical protein